MNWKEQFDKRFAHQQMGYFEGRNPLPKLGKSLLDKSLKDFISTEIIEKLIADIEKHLAIHRQLHEEVVGDSGREAHQFVIEQSEMLIQQLRDKWL